MKRILAFLMILLCVCNIALADMPADSSSAAPSSDTEEKEDDIIIVKVRDPVTKEEKEVEVRNGLMPDGKIFIGVGRKSKNLQKQRVINGTVVPGINPPAGEEDPNLKDKDKVSNKSVPGLHLVENMRALKGVVPHVFKGSGYVDPVTGETKNAGTSCAYTISLAAQGTPYGSKNADGTGGPITITDEFIARARDLGQLVEVVNLSESEKAAAYNNVAPGDILIVGRYKDGTPTAHAVMAKLNADGSIGTIQNGFGVGKGNQTVTTDNGTYYNCVNGVYEDDYHPSRTMEPWGYLIKSSGYAGSFMSGAFDALMQLGEALNKIIERFSKLAIAAHGKLYPVAFDLIALLCMIDLCLSIIMAGFEINPNTLFVKVLRYGFIYWVFVAWPTIVELFYQSLVISVNQTVNPDQFAVAADNICQPHLLLQKVIYLIKPGFDYMSSLSNWQVFKSMLSGGVMMLVVCGLLSIVVMILYILFAVYMSYVYISFFVYTALSTITLPFMSSKFVKFFTEGAVGAAWTAMIRLMVMTFLLGMMTVIFAGAGFENAKGLAAGANTADTVQLIKGNFEICTWYMTQCVTLSIFAVFMVKITDNICGKLGGRFEIGL